MSEQLRLPLPLPPLDKLKDPASSSPSSSTPQSVNCSSFGLLAAFEPNITWFPQSHFAFHSILGKKLRDGFCKVPHSWNAINRMLCAHNCIFPLEEDMPQVLFALHHVAMGLFICLIQILSLLILIRDEIRDGKSDKEIYRKLEDDFGETVLYAPKFDMQTAALWLSPLLVAGAAGGMWAYKKHRQKTNVHIMALNLVRGVPLTPKEKETMLEVLTPPPGGTSSSSWWRRWLQQ